MTRVYVHVDELNTSATTYGSDAVQHASRIWAQYRIDAPRRTWAVAGTITTHTVARCGYKREKVS